MKSLDVKDLGKLLKEWPERTTAIRAQTTYLSTERVYKDILNRIPSAQEFSTYRKALRFGHVAGTSKEEPAFAIYADSKAQRVKRLDRNKVLLYIKAKRKRRIRTPPEIFILEKFNPWTIDTLPFSPDKRWALTITRKAGARVVDSVAAKKKFQRSKIRKALFKAGVRKLKKDNNLKVPKSITGLPDIALEAIRAEFGLGKRSNPHWRPAILGLVHGGLRSMLKTATGKELISALTESDFQNWRKWPTRTTRQLKFAEARKYIGFQKRLGLRVS